MGFKPRQQLDRRALRLMSKAEEPKQPPARRLQLPGEDGTSQALCPAAREGAGLGSSCPLEPK